MIGISLSSKNQNAAHWDRNGSQPKMSMDFCLLDKEKAAGKRRDRDQVIQEE